MTRLPDPFEAERILAQANGAAHGTEEYKAKANLFKGIGWAYNGLTPAKRQAAQALYVQMYPGRNLAADVQKANLATLDDNTARNLLSALQSAEPALVHPGTQRLVDLNATQRGVLAQTLARLRTHLDEVDAGHWDDYVAMTFPDDSYKFWGREERQAANVAKAKRILNAGHAIISQWLNHDPGKIKIDRYLDSYGAAGLSSQANLVLAESFFTTKTNPDREEILAHESTHAIQDNDLVTKDAGGYIGTASWFQADTELRLKNASHLQYVVRLVQGNTPVVPGPNDDDPNIKAAVDIVRNAWIKSLNIYIQFHKYNTETRRQAAMGVDATYRQNLRDYMVNVSQLMGLPASKSPAGLPVISEGDLAALENKVGKMGVLLGAVKDAATALLTDNPPRAATVDAILAKLVEMQGPLRKSGNHNKTVQMIHTLNQMQIGTSRQMQVALNKFCATQF